MGACPDFATDDFLFRAPGLYHLDLHPDIMRETCRNYTEQYPNKAFNYRASVPPSWIRPERKAPACS